MSALFEAPTIEKFARFLTAPKTDLPLSKESPLRGTGDGPPVFYIPGLGGMGFMPKVLAQKIGAVRPYFDGLHFSGVDGKEPPATRLEDIAAYLIPQIRRIHPKGPYALCGYSFGGLLAYEVAQQLRSQGADVDVVILLDSWTSDSIKHDPRPFPEVIAVLGNCLKSMEVREMPRFIWSLIRRKLSFHSSRFIKTLQRIAALVLPTESLPQPTLNLSQKIMDASMQAFNAYRAQPYKGDALIVRTDEDTDEPENIFYKRDSTASQRWTELITGDIKIINIISHHLSMLRDEIIPALGDDVAGYLKERDASVRSQCQRTPSRCAVADPPP